MIATAMMESGYCDDGSVGGRSLQTPAIGVVAVDFNDGDNRELGFSRGK